MTTNKNKRRNEMTDSGLNFLKDMKKITQSIKITNRKSRLKSDGTEMKINY